MQVSLIEFGGFATPGYANAERLPVHPAYLDASGNPILPNPFAEQPSGSPSKAGDALWRFSREEKIPLRLALGKDAVQYATYKAQSLLHGLEQNASWSEDLTL
jgi:hypothetical protein